MELAPYQLSCNLYVYLWALIELHKHYDQGTISIGHFEHYFHIKKSTNCAHMYMIAKRARTSLIFKNLNKTEYIDKLMEILVEYYEGDVPLNNLTANKYMLVL